MRCGTLYSCYCRLRAAERRNCDGTISICTTAFSLSPSPRAACCCCNSDSISTRKISQWDAETWLLKPFNPRLIKHARRNTGKSDQTVVGNFQFIHYRPWHSSNGYFQFIAYTTDLGIQAVGNSDIAHRFNVKPRNSWTKYNSISAVCYYLGRRMDDLTSCLGGLDLQPQNDSDAPDGGFKYP